MQATATSDRRAGAAQRRVETTTQEQGDFTMAVPMTKSREIRGDASAAVPDKLINPCLLPNCQASSANSTTGTAHLQSRGQWPSSDPVPRKGAPVDSQGQCALRAPGGARRGDCERRRRISRSLSSSPALLAALMKTPAGGGS